MSIMSCINLQISKYVNSEYFLPLLEDEEELTAAIDFLHCQSIDNYE